MTVDEIIQKVKKEAQSKYKEQDTELKVVFSETTQSIKENSFYNFAKKIGKFLQRLGLNGFVSFVRRNIHFNQYNYTYGISDFNKYHDEEFIDNAYNIILNRPADFEGKNNYLSKLRDGTLSKTQIITTLHFSKEGKSQNITILGAKKRHVIAQLYKVPFVGYIAKSLFTLVTLPRLLKRLNQYENHTSVQIDTNKKELTQIKLFNQELKDSLEQSKEELQHSLQQSKKELQHSLQQSKKEFKKLLDDKASTKEFDLYLQAVNYAKEYMKLSQETIQTLSNKAKKAIPKRDLNQEELKSIIKEEQHKYDTLYVEFEDQFRGSREEVKDKLKLYIPYIEQLSQKNQNIDILDVGCGRGEWLELLNQNQYQNTKGIDLNKIMVKLSQDLNLDVKLYDVIEYLKTLKENSLDVITGFHIVEHLPFDIMMTLFHQSLRVLKKGGIVIFETPNSRNILVGSSDFYMDPTHINPIHPLTLKFLVQQAGFIDVNSYIISDNRLTNFDKINFDTLNDYVSIGRDLSVIGYKA